MENFPQAEVAYIDRQQGESCDQCGANLRSIALAIALRAFLSTKAFLLKALRFPVGENLTILRINEAGTLTTVLKTFWWLYFGASAKVDNSCAPLS